MLLALLLAINIGRISKSKVFYQEYRTEIEKENPC